MASPQFAFVPETRVARPRLSEGVLSGLTFAVKDLIAIRGHRSTAGHPEWARTHEPARRDAPVLQQLLRAGADLVGVTLLDELAYGLTGENPHYGTPQNPRADGRLCGGSSCGSAAAVAGCLCDFAIGTDTAGSVRVPASFCGLYGMRPTHGAISTEGVVPLAPSFDTVGLLARDARTFARVASVLLGASERLPIARVLIADAALAVCDAGVAELLVDQVERACKRLGVLVEPIQLAPEGFAPLREAQQRIGAREIWYTHGAWIEAVAPRFSPAVQARFDRARALAQHDEHRADDEALRDDLRARMHDLLPAGTLLLLPPTPGVAPALDASAAELDVQRARLIELTAIGSLTGLPQLVVPAHHLKGPPVGLSFMAKAGADAWLAQLAPSLDRALSS